MAKYLEFNQRSLRLQRKRVLDLGAGCGLVSIAAAMMGALPRRGFAAGRCRGG